MVKSRINLLFESNYRLSLISIFKILKNLSDYRDVHEIFERHFLEFVLGAAVPLIIYLRYVALEYSFHRQIRLRGNP